MAKNFIYNGLGFPVCLKRVKTRKVMGEAVPILNHAQFEVQVFEALLWSRSRLSGSQLAFVRSYMGLTQKQLAIELGQKGHARISQWENTGDKVSGMSSATELGVRLIMAFFLNTLGKYATHFQPILRGELEEPSIIELKEVA